MKRVRPHLSLAARSLPAILVCAWIIWHLLPIVQGIPSSLDHYLNDPLPTRSVRPSIVYVQPARESCGWTTASPQHIPAGC